MNSAFLRKFLWEIFQLFELQNCYKNSATSLNAPLPLAVITGQSLAGFAT